MSAPNAARLIHLLIEERAVVLAWKRHYRAMCLPTETETDQARREIEAEVLTTKK